MGKAKWTQSTWAGFKWGVSNTLFEDVMSKLSELSAVTATHLKLVLTQRDGVTGWRNKDYIATTVDAYFTLKASTPQYLPGGSYVRQDGLICTLQPNRAGDRFYVVDKYYEVTAVRTRYIGADLQYRESDLAEVTLYGR